MSHENNGSEGCLKALEYLGVTIFIIVVVAGALEGITDILSKIPWYLYVFVLIGFWYVMSKYFQ